RCCREHDRCEAQIAALEFNYGIRNYRLHTVSHCDCDGRCGGGGGPPGPVRSPLFRPAAPLTHPCRRFRRCLLDLNDTISNLIGVTFFDLLEVPCFVLEPSEQCVQWHWWGGCQSYGMVPLARMVQPQQYHAGPPSPPEE
ncbi:PA2G3 phospholipase, partial [Nothocercus nigrocapillus]|nr:PA2G3 phospholipase [Nothocercus nigrocapillus]